MERFTSVQIEKQDKVAVLRFNRPKQLNAMNRQMMDEIIEAIAWINDDEESLVAVICGNGRAFMAGADIKEYGSQTSREFAAFQEKGKLLYDSIERSSKPWIAAIDGFALGGGFEIALSCDLICASEQAKMGLPEVFLSLIPGGGGTQRLIQKTGINRVREILYFGAQYDSATMMDWGIVNRVFPNEDFFGQVMEFAVKLSRRPPSSVAQLKRLASLSLSPVLFEERIEDEAETVRKLFLADEAQSAIQGFISKSEK